MIKTERKAKENQKTADRIASKRSGKMQDKGKLSKRRREGQKKTGSAVQGLGNEGNKGKALERERGTKTGRKSVVEGQGEACTG